MTVILLTFVPSLIVALLLGWRGGKSDPQTPKDFLRSAAYYVAWCIMLVFVWHALWITSLVPSVWQDTVRSAFNATVFSAVIWVPALMITYVLSALRARRSG